MSLSDAEAGERTTQTVVTGVVAGGDVALSDSYAGLAVAGEMRVSDSFIVAAVAGNIDGEDVAVLLDARGAFLAGLGLGMLLTSLLRRRRRG